MHQSENILKNVQILKRSEERNIRPELHCWLMILNSMKSKIKGWTNLRIFIALLLNSFNLVGRNIWFCCL